MIWDEPQHKYNGTIWDEPQQDNGPIVSSHLACPELDSKDFPGCPRWASKSCNSLFKLIVFSGADDGCRREPSSVRMQCRLGTREKSL